MFGLIFKIGNKRFQAHISTRSTIRLGRPADLHVCIINLRIAWFVVTSVNGPMLCGLVGTVTASCQFRYSSLGSENRGPRGLDTETSRWRGRSKIPNGSVEIQPCRRWGLPAFLWRWRAAHQQPR